MMMKLWMYENHTSEVQGEELYESRSIAVIDFAGHYQKIRSPYGLLHSRF